MEVSSATRQNNLAGSDFQTLVLAARLRQEQQEAQLLAKQLASQSLVSQQHQQQLQFQFEATGGGNCKFSAAAARGELLAEQHRLGLMQRLGLLQTAAGQQQPLLRQVKPRELEQQNNRREDLQQQQQQLMIIDEELDDCPDESDCLESDDQFSSRRNSDDAPETYFAVPRNLKKSFIKRYRKSCFLPVSRASLNFVQRIMLYSSKLLNDSLLLLVHITLHSGLTNRATNRTTNPVDADSSSESSPPSSQAAAAAEQALNAAARGQSHQPIELTSVASSNELHNSAKRHLQHHHLAHVAHQQQHHRNSPLQQLHHQHLHSHHHSHLAHLHKAPDSSSPLIGAKCDQSEAAKQSIVGAGTGAPPQPPCSVSPTSSTSSAISSASCVLSSASSSTSSSAASSVSSSSGGRPAASGNSASGSPSGSSSSASSARNSVTPPGNRRRQQSNNGAGQGSPLPPSPADSGVSDVDSHYSSNDEHQIKASGKPPLGPRNTSSCPAQRRQALQQANKEDLPAPSESSQTTPPPPPPKNQTQTEQTGATAASASQQNATNEDAAARDDKQHLFASNPTVPCKYF